MTTTDERKKPDNRLVSAWPHVSAMMGSVVATALTGCLASASIDHGLMGMSHMLTVPDPVVVQPLVTLSSHEQEVERVLIFAKEIRMTARQAGHTAVTIYYDGVNAEHEELSSPFQPSPHQRLASRQLAFQDLTLEATATGGYRLIAVAVNKTHRRIHWATIAIEYMVNEVVVLRENFPWGPMGPYEKRNVGVLLRPITFDAVRIVPTYVHLGKPETTFAPREQTIFLGTAYDLPLAVRKRPVKSVEL